MRHVAVYVRAKIQVLKGLIQGKIRLINEMAVLPTLALTLVQLWGIANATTQTAQKYISEYEREHLERWSLIDEYVEKTFKESGSAEEYRNNIVAIKDQGDVKYAVDKMAAHFRAVLKCAEEDRCDESRVETYYEYPICSLWNKSRLYIEYRYTHKGLSKWNRNYGDLIGFVNERDCRAIENEAMEIPSRKADQGSMLSRLFG